MYELNQLRRNMDMKWAALKKQLERLEALEARLVVVEADNAELKAANLKLQREADLAAGAREEYVDFVFHLTARVVDLEE